MQFKPTYHQHCIRLCPGIDTGLQDILFVDGLTGSVDFDLDALLKLSWPEAKLHLHTFDFQKPEELAEALEQNNFKLIVLCNLAGDLERKYVDYPTRGRWLYLQLKPKLDRLNQAMEAAVKSKGATLVLFCAEAVDWVTSGMFGKPWKKAEYVRTDCFRAAAASCAVPSAPSSVNAKAVLLGGVPWEEQWYVTTSGSENNSILNSFIPGLSGPSPRPGLCSVAAGGAGAGRIVYVGDVNAEYSTARPLEQPRWSRVTPWRQSGEQVVQQLAAEMFPQAAPPQTMSLADAHQAAEGLKLTLGLGASRLSKRPRLEEEQLDPVSCGMADDVPAATTEAGYQNNLIRMFRGPHCTSMSLSELGQSVRRPPGVVGRLKPFLERDPVFKVEGDRVSLA